MGLSIQVRPSERRLRSSRMLEDTKSSKEALDRGKALRTFFFKLRIRYSGTSYCYRAFGFWTLLVIIDRVSGCSLRRNDCLSGRVESLDSWWY